MPESNDSHNANPALDIASRIISWIFSPLIMPAYGTWLAMWGSPLAWLPERTRWYAVIYTAAITGLLPLTAILIMRLAGTVSDPSLRDRRERSLPYTIAALCYMACGWYFIQAHAPQWLVMFFAGGAAAIIVAAIVNLRWKISAHATAAGGLVALVIRLIVINRCGFDLTGALTGVILAAGLSGTARLILNRHTPMQIWLGYINGLTCTLIASSIDIGL
ncbi:MAG: hypothetical protein K2L49_03700 [Muribaculaceae bacterium]|nr:hypothetical protein [Muribaculaceae bacterium]